MSKKQDILQAFIVLFVDQPFSKIQMIDIANCAQIPRSTLYRYFSSKIDILLYFHAHIFDTIDIVPRTKDDWLSSSVSPLFHRFLQRLQQEYRYHPFIMELGNEVDYFTRELRQMVAERIHNSLQECFTDEPLRIPVNVLARMMSGALIEAFLWLSEAPEQHDIGEMSNHIHATLQGLLQQALIPENDNNNLSML